MPGKYRGVNLTSQLSKTGERLIGLLFLPYLGEPGQSGKNQFAYIKKKGGRDALAILTFAWLNGLNARRKIAVLCSDVSGAFDRVCRKRLLKKLRKMGLHSKIIAVVESWLQANSDR